MNGQASKRHIDISDLYIYVFSSHYLYSCRFCPCKETLLISVTKVLSRGVDLVSVNRIRQCIHIF